MISYYLIIKNLNLIFIAKLYLTRDANVSSALRPAKVLNPHENIYELIIVIVEILQIRQTVV